MPKRKFCGNKTHLNEQPRSKFSQRRVEKVFLPSEEDKIVYAWPDEDERCVPLGCSGSGSENQDHSDHGLSKEPTNPLWSRIPLLL